MLIEHPSVFVAMLKATGRDDEVSGVDNYEGMTLFIDNTLKPYLKRIEAKLH